MFVRAKLWGWSRAKQVGGSCRQAYMESGECEQLLLMLVLSTRRFFRRSPRRAKVAQKV